LSLLSYTRTLLVAQIRRQLGERTSGLFQDADIQRWIDEGLGDIAARTKCLRAEASADSVASQQAYTIPNNCIGAWAITRVEHNGGKLDQRGFDQVDTEFGVANGKSLSSTGTPSVWLPYGRHFKLWPIPTTATTGVMQIYYAKMPDSLSADAMSIADLGFSLAHGPAVIAWSVANGWYLAGEVARADGAMAMYERHLGNASNKMMGDNIPREARGSG
jgi:hypothetical protein